jgi:hypothetical protein
MLCLAAYIVNVTDAASLIRVVSGSKRLDSRRRLSGSHGGLVAYRHQHQLRLSESNFVNALS